MSAGSNLLAQSSGGAADNVANWNAESGGKHSMQFARTSSYHARLMNSPYQEGAKHPIKGTAVMQSQYYSPATTTPGGHQYPMTSGGNATQSMRSAVTAQPFYANHAAPGHVQSERPTFSQTARYSRNYDTAL